jgi:hypothetical protein
VFYDTNSIAFARPDTIARSDFEHKVEAIRNWFKPLNPYGDGGSILELKDEHASLAGEPPPPLYVFRVSAKR